MGVVSHYCLGGCNALLVCARRARLVRSGAGAFLCSPSPLSSGVLRGFRGGCGALCRISFVLARWYAIPCCLRVPRSGSGRPFTSRRPPLCVLVRAHSRVAGALAVLLRLPPALFPVRALREVPLQGAARAVPCGSCPFAFPIRVPAPWFLWGGGGHSDPRSALPSGVWA